MPENRSRNFRSRRATFRLRCTPVSYVTCAARLEPSEVANGQCRDMYEPFVNILGTLGCCCFPHFDGSYAGRAAHRTRLRKYLWKSRPTENLTRTTGRAFAGLSRWTGSPFSVPTTFRS